MKLRLDAFDWEFQSGNKQYIFAFDEGELENEVEFSFRSDQFCDVYAETQKEELLPLCSGTSGDFKGTLNGFVALHCKTAEKTKVAFKVLTFSRGEKLDPTPLAVSMASKREETIHDAVRKALAQILGDYGSDAHPDEFDLSPLDGDFSEDEEMDGSYSPHQFDPDVIEDDPEDDEPDRSVPPKVENDQEDDPAPDPDK